MKHLSKNLRYLMESAKLSENELARRTGVPQQMINRILNGKNENPKIATLLPLAQYFTVLLSDLLGDTLDNHKTMLSINHLGWRKVPLIAWKDINTYLKNNNKFLDFKKTVLTDAPVSNKAFALEMIDNSMALKFEKGTLLIFDPEKIPSNKDYTLILDSADNSLPLVRQYFIKQGKINIKCLNPKLPCYKMIPLNEKSQRVIAVLTQSRLDHFSKESVC